MNNSAYVVSLEPLSSDEMPVSVVLPEFMRRMKEMSQAGGMFMGEMPDQYSIAVNANHPIMQKILSAEETEREKLAKHTYDLALLSQGLLKGGELTNFVKRSLEITK